jgi:hypothetical protein
MITSLLLALLLQDPAASNGLPTDKEADAAIKIFKAAVDTTTSDDNKIAAAKEALKTRHEKVIKSAAELLSDPSDKVRVAIAIALSEVDHPASVDMLLAALAANEKRPMTLAAVASGLGTLGYEAAAPRMNEYVKKVGDDEIRTALPDIMEALGAIGSLTSIDAITGLLHKLEGPRRNPWGNEGELLKAARGALKAITGIAASGKVNDWEDEWKAAKAGAMAGAKVTFWNKKTGARVTQGVGERAPADSMAINTRVTEPAAPATEGKGGGKKKKKDK